MFLLWSAERELHDPDTITKAILDFRRSPIWREHIDAIGAFHSDGYSADAFDIRLSRPGKYEIPCQLDGEEWLSGDTFRVQVLPRLLPLLTPPERWETSTTIWSIVTRPRTGHRLPPTRREYLPVRGH